VICDTSGEGIGGGIVDSSRIPRGLLDPGALGVGTGSSQGGGPARDFPYVLGGLAFLLLIGWLFVTRYLRPRTVGGVWKRLNLLSRIAGFGRRDGETPHEFGARLAREVPEAAGPILELADKFALSAYAPEEVAASAHEPVLSAWADVRPVLLRQVTRRRRAA
jgi:hypothetical protein